MSLTAIGWSFPLGTSAEGAMRSEPRPRFVAIPGSLSAPGTHARSPSVGGRPAPALAPARTSAALQPAVEPAPPVLDPAEALSELRRLTGLTWEQLARVFGVARRSLHYWASGRPMNAANLEKLYELLEVLRQVDRGTAAENRGALLAERAGTRPCELLAEGRYDAFLALIGPGPGRRAPRLPPLSRKARESRMPLPPTESVDVRHEPVHRNIGRGRPARTVRASRRERDG